MRPALFQKNHDMAWHRCSYTLLLNVLDTISLKSFCTACGTCGVGLASPSSSGEGEREREGKKFSSRIDCAHVHVIVFYLLTPCTW